MSADKNVLDKLFMNIDYLSKACLLPSSVYRLTVHFPSFKHIFHQLWYAQIYPVVEIPILLHRKKLDWTIYLFTSMGVWKYLCVCAHMKTKVNIKSLAHSPSHLLRCIILLNVESLKSTSLDIQLAAQISCFCLPISGNMGGLSCLTAVPNHALHFCAIRSLSKGP